MKLKQNRFHRLYLVVVEGTFKFYLGWRTPMRSSLGRIFATSRQMVTTVLEISIP